MKRSNVAENALLALFHSLIRASSIPGGAWSLKKLQSLRHCLTFSTFYRQPFRPLQINLVKILMYKKNFEWHWIKDQVSEFFLKKTLFKKDLGGGESEFAHIHSCKILDCMELRRFIWSNSRECQKSFYLSLSYIFLILQMQKFSWL